MNLNLSVHAVFYIDVVFKNEGVRNSSGLKFTCPLLGMTIGASNF